MKKCFLACVLTLCMAYALCACGGGESAASPQPEPPAPPPAEDITPPDESDPGDMSELDYTPEPVEPAKPEGLVFFSINTTSSAQNLVFEILCLNPETGKETLISSISVPKATDPLRIDYYQVESMRRMIFSQDYSKIAVTKFFVANGERHAGWIDTNGDFFDVTEALDLASKSDFDEPVYYSSVGFSGSLYGYSRLNNLKANHNYVPEDNVTSSSIQEGRVFAVEHPADENGFLINGRYSAWDVTSWIDDTRCLVNDGFNDKKGSFLVDIQAQTATKYIPGDSRNNWNAVISPDGAKIAFMSAPKERTAPLSDVYIIPIDGGDPTKVAGCPSPLATVADILQYNCYILIDWI